ncbi:MAG: M3 family metallopeptidase [Prolixibacteraceae bacterium]|jgi:peptidyl-dipeptidase Dcp|nr:M3 family metallopeptidase [Prolixibacteraceae bacterium]
MKTRTLLFITMILFFSACNTGTNENGNPFLEEYDTPYGVPPFDLIKIEHYVPAFNEAIDEHNVEIEAIVAKTNAPTFENTILALEYSGQLLQKVSTVFGNQMSANTNDELQTIAKDIYPLLSKHSDEIMLNAKLFERVKAVYDNKDKLNLDKESNKLLDETYKDFVRSGANIPDNKKEELKKINEELSLLSLQFGENLLAETNDYKLVINNKEYLAGLPESVISAAAEASGEDGKWVFTLHKPSWIPFLQYAQKRDLREKLYKAMYMRGNNENENDNKEIIKKILNLRNQRANIMGYETHADFELSDRMAKVPANVYDLLNQLWTPALEMAKKEAGEMQKMIYAEGDDFELESWDWWYYAEKIRKQKYDLDDSEIRPYFELNNVREGAFTLANILWGINFEEINNVPLPHSDAKSFEVTDADSSLIGVFYVDYHPRESKRGGAWMSSYRKQSQTKDGNFIHPVITNVMNFSKPTGGKPALLSFDEVTTLFHEFGHGLHGLLSNCKYHSLSGTSVPRDFVELPSQIMENWCAKPEMMKLFAKHYETGKVIPQQLIDKIVASSQFNQGFATIEYLAASFLDMDYHTQKDVENINIEAFEKKSMDKIGLLDEIIPRYKSSYFNHIWASGYSAGYYSYIWAEVLDADAFNYFVESGDIFNKEIANSFRENILSKGGTGDAMTMYRTFRGQEPSIESLLEKRGLK